MKSFKRLNQNGVISVLLIVLVVVLLAAGAGFYVWQKNANKTPASSTPSSSSSKPDTTPKKTTASTPATDKTACKDPSSSVVENVQASISSGNTAALEGYMASTVKVILAATEGIGDQTPTQAVGDITTFIGDPTTTSWDFALPAATITGYKATPYVTYFPTNAVVGKSSTDKVISFSFDCTGKINVVFEAGKSSLLQ